MKSLHEEEALGRPYDARLMRRFLTYLRPHRKLVALCLVVSWTSIAVELAVPFILKGALDGPVAAGDSRGLYLFAVLFLIVAVLHGLFEALTHYISNLAGQSIVYDIRTEAFAHLQKMPTAFFDANPVGRLLTRVTGDVENLSEFFTSGLVGMLGSSLMLVGIISAMLFVDWRLTLWTMTTLPLVLAGAAFFRSRARVIYRETRRAIAAATAYLNETLGGIKTIRIFNREETCAARFAEKSELFRESATQAAYIYSFFWPGIDLVTTLSISILIWYASRAIPGGTMSFGTFVAFLYLVRKFFEPIQDLAEKYNILQAAMASSERIFRLLDTDPAIASPDRPKNPAVEHSIVFDRVSFSYDGVTPVLKDISFEVKPGETVAVVGYTGAGKTTILSLLLRLYDVSSGRILVDGTDVRDFDLDTLRRRFGMVFQDVFLFSGSIEDNLTMGESIDRKLLDKALDLSNARRITAKLPQGTATLVMERGAAFSAGERQIFSLARALACDPGTLLLDEATSSVDAETEWLIQEALEKSLRHRTAVIVAHRLSTVRRADKILVLHHGALREQGTHDELLKLGGLYEKLYRLQFQPA